MTVTREQFVFAAMQYLGVPYKWGGFDRRGLDCSGLVVRALTDLGLAAPPFDATCDHMATHMTAITTPQLGDLVLFPKASGDGFVHVGIYLGKSLNGFLYVLESAGGGSECLTLEKARKLGADVRVGIPRRTHGIFADIGEILDGKIICGPHGLKRNEQWTPKTS